MIKIWAADAGRIMPLKPKIRVSRYFFISAYKDFKVEFLECKR